MIEEERQRLRIPAWCPICDEVMKGSISSATYGKWGCCMHCHVIFVEDREERWRSGWRPSAEEVAAKRGGPIWAKPPDP